jgi:hypothetical protein
VLVEIDADHEALFTAPAALAWALLEAIAGGPQRESPSRSAVAW